jgi:GNAT superfamily N-acetyltransferase
VQAVKDFLRGRFERDETLFVMAFNGNEEAVGFVHLFPSFSSVSLCRIWILNDLYVYQAFRKNGIGRALMEKAAELARREGVKRLFIETAVSNHTAQRLYENLGYRKEEEEYFYTLHL